MEPPLKNNWVRERNSALLWGAAIPSMIAIAAVLTQGLGALLLAVFPLQVFRIAKYRQNCGDSRFECLPVRHILHSRKIPEALGVLRFAYHRILWQAKHAHRIQISGQIF